VFLEPKKLLGLLFPTAVLFLSFTFVFYIALLYIKNKISNFYAAFKLASSHKNEILSYIDEIKKNNLV
jgi:hypothetical protein